MITPILISKSITYELGNDLKTHFCNPKRGMSMYELDEILGFKVSTWCWGDTQASKEDVDRARAYLKEDEVEQIAKRMEKLHSAKEKHPESFLKDNSERLAFLLELHKNDESERAHGLVFVWVKDKVFKKADFIEYMKKINVV